MSSLSALPPVDLGLQHDDITFWTHGHVAMQCMQMNSQTKSTADGRVYLVNDALTAEGLCPSGMVADIIAM
jgi:hypothetical protein